MMHRFVSGLAFAMIVAAGCAAKASLPPQSEVSVLSKTQHAPDVQPAKALYVVNNEAHSVTVYEVGSRTVARTLTAPQMYGPSAVAFDSLGNAYVANFGGGPSSIPSGIFVYKPGTTVPYMTITAGTDLPDRLAFDASGNLYVANFGFKHPASVSVFAPGANKPTRIIYNGVFNAISLAFDSDDNLYVTNHSGSANDKGSVSVYAPSTTKPAYTITLGIHYPNQAILDRTDNLYVANDEGGISVYRRGNTTPAKIIDRQLPYVALAFDTKGKLYGLSRSLFVYTPSKSKPFKTINNRDPYSLAIDPDDNVFVGDNPLGCGKAGKKRNVGCIRVFRPGSTAPWYQIDDSDTPYALAFGPP